MTLKPLILSIYFSVALSSNYLFSQRDYREHLGAAESMDTTGIGPNLATILEEYYENNLGGAEAWGRVKSIRYVGVLQASDSSVPFVVFKRKPNYIKTTLNLKNGIRIIKAYDGEDAWQFNSAYTNAEPESMPEDEAHDFIREAIFGSHLLYPLMDGKAIELIGTAVVDGERCYEIQVTLPEGDKLKYFLDAVDFSERRVVTISSKTGVEQTTTHYNFKKVEGISFPFTSVNQSASELSHRVEMKEVIINAGAMSWMFGRDSVDRNRDLQEPAPQIWIEGDKMDQSTQISTMDSFMEMNAPTVPSIVDKIGKNQDAGSAPFSN